MRISARFGFTLLELAVVVVIIALVIAAILLGNDLIAAAKARQQVGQYEQYVSAIGAFKLKTGFLPGDIPDTQAVSFGLESRDGTLGNGDGDGLVSQYNLTKLGCGENVLFFDDLAKFGLINKAPTFNGNYPNDCLPANNWNDFSKQMPTAVMGRQNYIMEGLDFIDVNRLALYIVLADPSYMTSNGIMSLPVGLTPNEAYAIDQKIDDGRPGGGLVFGIDLSGVPDECSVITGSDGRYNTSGSAGNELHCHIVFRTSY